MAKPKEVHASVVSLSEGCCFNWDQGFVRVARR